MGQKIFEDLEFMGRLIVIAASLLAATAVAQVTPVPVPIPPERPPVEQPPPAMVTPLALAHTPEEGTTRLEVEAWQEEGPALGGTVGWRVDYFTVMPAPIRLNVGDTFDLTQLRIEAYGLNGNVVGAAPLKLELEAPDGLIDLALATENHELVALRPGIGRLWIESYLPRGTGSGERYRLPVVILAR